MITGFLYRLKACVCVCVILLYKKRGVRRNAPGHMKIKELITCSIFITNPENNLINKHEIIYKCLHNLYNCKNPTLFFS